MKSTLFFTVIGLLSIMAKAFRESAICTPSCRPNQYCSNAKCMDACTPSCTSNQYCSNGKCMDACKSCSSSQYCSDDKVCVEKKKILRSCKEDYECKTNHCSSSLFGWQRCTLK